jgi:hypothetical protein
MPDQPLPEPIPYPTGPLDPAHAKPIPSQRPRCRALTAGGYRCKNYVVGGLHLCFSHYRNRRPAFPDPRNLSIPLIEDRATLQLVSTQIVQGVLSNRLDPVRARIAIAALRFAALTIPGLYKPVAPPKTTAPAAPQESPEDTVCHLGRDHEDFISADGDLDEPPLNPSCSVAESAGAARQLLDTLEPASHCPPEDEDPEVVIPSAEHDWENCPCFTCADYRELIRQRIERDRVASGG